VNGTLIGRVPPAVQTLVIPAWLPEQVANGPHGHWSTRQKKLGNAQLVTWSAAKNARWIPVTGRAKLTVTFIFPVRRRRDIDNLYARAKGVVDGVKRGGWIVDDSSEWLDLSVLAEVEPGLRATVLKLEPL